MTMTHKHIPIHLQLIKHQHMHQNMHLNRCDKFITLILLKSAYKSSFFFQVLLIDQQIKLKVVTSKEWSQ